MDFALNEIDTKTGAEQGAQIPLLRLDGSPLTNALDKPVTITVLGSDSSLYRRLQRELGRKRLERMQKNRGKTLTDDQLDEVEKEDILVLAKITTGWDGVLDTAKKPIPFSLENVTDLYTKYPVAREQVEGALLDRARFIQPSSKG